MSASGSSRILVASVGWAGHLFPGLSLARELRDRGHSVHVETFGRWRDTVEREGLGFLPASERISFPPASAPDAPSLSSVAEELGRVLRRLRIDLVVSDLYTLAPPLAAELEGLPAASLIPHPYPGIGDGLPPYTLGLRPPRTAIGRHAWRAFGPFLGARLPNTRLRPTRDALDRTRSELGLEPTRALNGQISNRLAIVATFPQLEYPREWPAAVRVTGPLPFELEHPAIALPPGDEPLVLVASSTERDPAMRLVRTSLAALAEEPVRVVAATNRPGSGFRGSVPANAVVHDWVSYSQVLAEASLVVCHGGHGTIARALAAGVPVLVAPPAGDMAENGARVAWSGAGSVLPFRLLSPGALRAAALSLLHAPEPRNVAAELREWAAGNPGPRRAAELAEEAIG